MSVICIISISYSYMNLIIDDSALLVLLSLSLGNAHGQLLFSPVVSESCSAINISVLSEIVQTVMNHNYSMRPCSCGGPEWTKAVYLNMSDPSQSCPSNWTVVNSSIRGCGQTTVNGIKCDSVYYLWVAVILEFVVEL